MILLLKNIVMEQIKPPQFIKLYKGDVLGDFRDQIQAMTVTKLPEMPEYGILNINEVMESEFFFS